jgi:hypothetical protein
MVKPFVKELTQWQILRNHLKKKYNKDLQEIFFILTCPDEASKEDLKIANKFKELYDVIKQVYELTQNIAEIRTMIKVG